jgi:predicted TIM-barrel fold metal-dependent hydrolase
MKSNSFDETLEHMERAGVEWAWAVAMDTTNAYDLNHYVEACNSAKKKLIAAAYIRPNQFLSQSQIDDYLGVIKEKGYRGIKMHPRLGEFTFEQRWLPSIISSASAHGLIPLLCTYCYGRKSEVFSARKLQKLLQATGDAKLVLLHGGVLGLLETSEITRHFKNVMLDVSWTMCEYAGSSLDLDLKYVFENCTDRVCIGSDAPSLSPTKMRERFEWLTSSMSNEKKEKLAFRNLLDYTGV